MADVDDEDSWLYGDTTKEKTSIPSINNLNEKQPVEVENEEKIEQEHLVVTAPVVENGKESDGVDTTSLETKENNGKNEDDDEDSDDDVQVTIGEITTGGTPGNFPTQGLSRTFYRNPVPVPPKPTVSKGLDMQAPGDINGTPVMETNIDLLDDKPWRKPGADISDYFNYGFNEDTWKQYCDKQKKFRGQLDNTPVITLPLPKPTQNGTSLFSTPPYVPLAKFENTVRNISTLQFSRRKEDELLAASAAAAAASAVQNQAQNATPVPSSLPPSSATQVFLPQMRQTISGSLPNAPLPFPPINPNQPPPGLPIGVPPPFMMSNVPPPGIPPPGVVPPEYLQSAPPGYPPGFQPPVSHTVPPPMFNQQDGGDSYNQYPEDRHMRPSDSETDRHSEDDGRYRRERGSSSRRDYERDRYSRRDYRDSRPRDRDRDRSERDRDRDRDRERDRDRDREKDRDRDKERDRDRDRGHERESSSSRRYRDDSPSRHKSSRRKHEDDDRHSSKHKKAKKHKHKDKESDAPPPGTDDVGNEEGEK